MKFLAEILNTVSLRCIKQTKNNIFSGLGHSLATSFIRKTLYDIPNPALKNRKIFKGRGNNLNMEVKSMVVSLLSWKFRGGIITSPVTNDGLRRLIMQSPRYIWPERTLVGSSGP